MHKEEIVIELQKLVDFIGNNYVDEFAANQINGYVSNQLKDIINKLEAENGNAV